MSFLSLMAIAVISASLSATLRLFQFLLLLGKPVRDCFALGHVRVNIALLLLAPFQSG